MLLNRLATQQKFLPTDTTMEAPAWAYGFAAFMLIAGVILLVSKSEGLILCMFGLVFLAMCFSRSGPDISQNNDNFIANVKSVYSVDEVTLLDHRLDNGDTIKINSDGRTYEVIANWDTETYEPTLYPVAVEIEDLEALKK